MKDNEQEFWDAAFIAALPTALRQTVIDCERRSLGTGKGMDEPTFILENSAQAAADVADTAVCKRRNRRKRQEARHET